MIETVLQKIVDGLIEADLRLDLNIREFLSKYSFSTKNVPFSQDNVVFLIKLSAYSLFLIIPLAALKISFRENKLISFLFAITLLTFASSLFGIFLGFFQLLFT